jgi:alkylated DNA repair dioxygenase AlkB
VRDRPAGHGDVRRYFSPVARAPTEEPEGIVYRPELLTVDVEAELLRVAEILVQDYPPGATIGRHRDAPAFDTVVGISLGGASRMRFQRGKREQRRVWALALEPRSGYVLSGEARRSWEHSIPAAKERRYSITFRTLRNRR